MWTDLWGGRKEDGFVGGGGGGGGCLSPCCLVWAGQTTAAKIALNFCSSFEGPQSPQLISQLLPQIPSLFHLGGQNFYSGPAQ